MPCSLAASGVLSAAPPPQPQVSLTPLPPRPPDSSLVARQAAGKADPTLASSPASLPVNAGLIVCDLVSLNPALTPFGIACGRWVDLIAAGQPELG